MFQHTFAHISAHFFKRRCIALRFFPLWRFDLLDSSLKAMASHAQQQDSFNQYNKTHSINTFAKFTNWLTQSAANGWIQQSYTGCSPLTVPFHHARTERHQAQQWIPWTCKHWRWDAKKQIHHPPGITDEDMPSNKKPKSKPLAVCWPMAPVSLLALFFWCQHNMLWKQKQRSKSPRISPWQFAGLWPLSVCWLYSFSGKQKAAYNLWTLWKQST